MLKESVKIERFGSQICLLTLTVLASLMPATTCLGRSGDLSASVRAHDFFIRLQQSLVARIDCGGLGSPIEAQATAFLAYLPSEKNLVFAVTNRHVVESCRSGFNLYLPLGHETGIDSVHRYSIDPHFFEQDDEIPRETGAIVLSRIADLAVVVVEIKSEDESITTTTALSMLSPKNLCRWGDLLPGQLVTFVGFPLGMRAGNNAPLIRGGMIAGLNKATDRVLIDGQVFSGSSGSPVFLDRRDPASSSAGSAGRWIVGVVSSYSGVPDWQDHRTIGQGVKMTENSGIGFVVPAATLYEMLIGLRLRDKE